MDIKQVKNIVMIIKNGFYIHQIEDGEDFRVLISPLPPKVVEEVKEEKKVVKKKNDNRSAG